jgi:hypothetical protein
MKLGTSACCTLSQKYLHPPEMATATWWTLSEKSTAACRVRVTFMYTENTQLRCRRKRLCSGYFGQCATLKNLPWRTFLQEMSLRYSFWEKFLFYSID